MRLALLSADEEEVVEIEVTDELRNLSPAAGRITGRSRDVARVVRAAGEEEENIDGVVVPRAVKKDVEDGGMGAASGEATVEELVDVGELTSDALGDVTGLVIVVDGLVIRRGWCLLM